MAFADTITQLGDSILNLISSRSNVDLSNISTAGETKIQTIAGGGSAIASAPVGTVIAYMGTEEPEGYLLMDGREVSKTTYADLYAVVGDSMGTAADTANFLIADMTDGRYLMGSTVAGTSVVAGLPNIIGSFEGGYSNHYHCSGAFEKSSQADTYAQGSNSNFMVTNFYASRCSNVYGNSATVTPLSLSSQYYIKY